jgi:Flp pilus assembly protein TadG
VTLPRRRGDRGQAAVELALGLPLVFLALLAVVQVVLVARDQLAVIHAAREGARAAAVADGAGAGEPAARAALGLDPGRAEVVARRGGGRAVVTVRYRSPTDVPLVGAVLGDVTVQATATMLLEP